MILELPVLPIKLVVLYCNENKLTALPELPEGLETLCCECNNIKYLSRHNCSVIKNIKYIVIIANPVSDGFISDKKFIESL